MRFAMVGAFVSAGLAFTLLPRRPAHVHPRQTIVVILLQWLLLTGGRSSFLAHFRRLMHRRD